MAYKKYTDEAGQKINKLRARMKYWGNKKKSAPDFNYSLKRYRNLQSEIERIIADPKSYLVRKPKYKGENLKAIVSVRSFISQIKHKRPDWSHKLPALQERLQQLLKAG